MTKNDLDKYRKYVPMWIIGSCIIPWFAMQLTDLSKVKFANDIIVPLIAAILGFFYVGLGVSRKMWEKEIDKHVADQIRENLLGMIPLDLGVTGSERTDIKGEVFKRLTGVFWEAIDRDEILRSHKEHFYSNGILYSSSIDVYLIGLCSSAAYFVAAYLMKSPGMLYIGIGMLLVAGISRLFVLPSRRAQHLALSAEQLNLLQRSQLDFIHQRFREIITNWRRPISS